MLPCAWCSQAAYKQPPGHGTRCNHPNDPELLQQRPAGCCWAASQAAAVASLSCMTLPHVPRLNSHGCSCGRHTLDCWAAPAAQQRAALQLCTQQQHSHARLVGGVWGRSVRLPRQGSTCCLPAACQAGIQLSGHTAASCAAGHDVRPGGNQPMLPAPGPLTGTGQCQYLSAWIRCIPALLQTWPWGHILCCCTRLAADDSQQT